MGTQVWAIPPDHPIFGRGDDRDDGELSAQGHAGPMFRFGDTWNDLISERRRASLLAFVSRCLAARQFGASTPQVSIPHVVSPGIGYG
jgi:hypothetical protein